MTERAFNKGDKVAHKQLPSLWKGEVVRYYKPSSWEHGVIIWKGHDPFNPDKIDWTWDFAMDKLPPGTDVRRCGCGDGSFVADCKGAACKAHNRCCWQ